MDCIQSENKAVDLFGADNHGFAAGVPAEGLLATFVTPQWCNGVQEEILNVIRAAGIVKSGVDLTQLLQAIQFMIGAKTGGVGEVKLFYRKSPPSGWLKINGTSIGNAGSGATQRANADTQALFTHLWTEFTNAEVPIQTNTGAASVRGASAAADFAAGKRIVLSDARGGWLRVLDDGRGIDPARTVGSWQEQQMLDHDHPATVTELPHTHQWGDNGQTGVTPGSGNLGDPGDGYFSPTSPATTGLTVDVGMSGGGAELRTRNTAWLLCVSY